MTAAFWRAWRPYRPVMPLRLSKYSTAWPPISTCQKITFSIRKAASILCVLLSFITTSTQSRSSRSGRTVKCMLNLFHLLGNSLALESSTLNTNNTSALQMTGRRLLSKEFDKVTSQLLILKPCFKIWINSYSKPSVSLLFVASMQKFVSQNESKLRLTCRDKADKFLSVVTFG